MMTKFLILFVLLIPFAALAQSDLVETNAGALTVTPVMHGSLVLEWKGKTILVDPYGGAEKFAAYRVPDLVLITDIHGDHLHQETLKGLVLENATLIAPKAVMEQLGDIRFKEKTPLSNGEEIRWQEVKLEAIPMYNLPELPDARHPKGRGNGYVLELGNRRVYISGDTEATPEMRMLTNIDLAFVCMNLPYTMDVEQAAEGVLAFKPRIVYPYHFRGAGGKFSDVEKFKELVESKDPSIEVRLRNWYPQYE